MAGIGFALQRMAEGRSLTGQASAYLYSTFIVAGPWVFMVLAIAGQSLAACPADRCVEVQSFRSILVYNFLFSLIISSMISLPITRYVSDEIYAKRDQFIAGACVVALGIFVLITALTVGPFYLFLADLSWAHKLAALNNVMLVGAAWIMAPFLGALRDYRSVSLAFLLGGAAMVGAAAIAPKANSLALLESFNLGLAIINAGIVWRLMREYGANLRFDSGLIGAFLRYWDLAAIGFVIYAGQWIDKAIMWALSPTGTIEVAGVFRTMPDYDAVMFWAQLTTLPILAVFFVHVETNFYRLYKGFYDCFERHASRREVEERQAALVAFVHRNLFGLLAAMLVITVGAMLASFVAIETIGLRANQMGILRAGLLGVAFQTGVTFCTIFLLYFDLRRYALTVVLIYAGLNAALTLAFLPLGFAYYGYGQMVAAIISFVAALAVLSRELPWLHYHAFVTNNASLRRQTRFTLFRRKA
jgi:uncharacterized membrane protein